jgi:microsomal dipeptidase-like Zn-dependent dipeptidase
LPAGEYRAKVPRTLSYESNDDRSDLITPLAIVQRWPPTTWSSLKERALYQARKLHQLAESLQGKLVVIETRRDLTDFIERRKQRPDVVGGLLAMEGMHPLEGKLENLEEFYRAGFRMMAPVHFFDNDLGGSAHGIKKGGLTDFGRQALKRMEESGIVVDVAHASPKMIDDILALANKPVVCSHTGVKGTCAGNRNLSDKHLRGIARTGGVVGIGLWAGAVCANDVRATARAMRYTANSIGVDHVALGSDFDGAITAPIDAGEMAQVTAALLEEGFSEDEIFKIMGGNVLRLLLAVLPSR